MKNLISKLLLSTLVTLGAANALYSMEESAGYTQPVREVYFALGEFLISSTPQNTANRLATLKDKIAKLNASETKLRDNFTGNATILEVAQNTLKNNFNTLSPIQRQGLQEAIKLLEEKPFNK
ncbi:MAG: hypothetical protein AMXMBFR12_05350 [Candidatus Babeliales bacterium]